MKKLLILFVLISLQLSAQPVKVLFIGNSYTAANSLAVLFEQLALSKGDSVEAYSVNPGGYTFHQHVVYPLTLQMIDSMDWDFVVLQEQSQLPSFPPSQVVTDVYPYARQLDSLIVLNNPCTETVFFMTWGRKYGDASNCAFYPPLCTFLGMQQQLRNSYVTMANDNHALVAPVGEAWKRSWLNDSTINLWVSDNSHPDVPGSYLAACVFYSTIFRKSTVGATYTAGLSPTVTGYLQGIADTTVFDSLSTWKIGTYDVQAGATFVNNGMDVQFTNTTTNGIYFFWDFGDGTTSTDVDPLHSFPGSGNWMVTLIANDNCSSDTVVFTVATGTVGQSEMNGVSCVEFRDNILQLNCHDFRILAVYGHDGRLLDAADLTGKTQLPVSGYPTGLYSFVFQRNSGEQAVVRRWIR